MTSLTLLSDIHSNAHALQQVLKQEPPETTYIILGDILGLCGWPAETVESICWLDGYFIKGNHDVAIIEHGEGHVNSPELSEYEYQHTMDKLSTQQVEWIKSLDSFDIRQFGPHRICLTHAMPWPEQSSGYEQGNAGVTKRDLPSIASIVADDYDYVFHGHTHNQFEQDCAKFGHDVQFVNPGSLGYDGTYCTIDIDTGDVTMKSVEVELAKTVPDDSPISDRFT
jgi:predicted phosphodiesterase